MPPLSFLVSQAGSSRDADVLPGVFTWQEWSPGAAVVLGMGGAFSLVACTGPQSLGMWTPMSRRF